MLLAKTEDDFLKVKQFKKNYCDDDRVGVAEFQDDGFDSGSYVFFSTDTKEHVFSRRKTIATIYFRYAWRGQENRRVWPFLDY